MDTFAAFQERLTRIETGIQALRDEIEALKAAGGMTAATEEALLARVDAIADAFGPDPVEPPAEPPA